MKKRGRSPVDALARSNPLSGPAPFDVVLHRRCDQVMSPPQLAPSRAVQTSVSHGRDLEIPTTLWRRVSRSGHELKLERLDPDGCVVRTRSKPYQQEIGSARWAAGTTVSCSDQGGSFLLWKMCLLDRSLLMGARRAYNPTVGAQPPARRAYNPTVGARPSARRRLYRFALSIPYVSLTAVGIYFPPRA
jgi:hypothetical protein